MSDKAKDTMARRLFKEFRPTTDAGDPISLHDFEAATLAEIIAEYVDAAIEHAKEKKP
jgi:hypothetical protein